MSVSKQKRHQLQTVSELCMVCIRVEILCPIPKCIVNMQFKDFVIDGF